MDHINFACTLQGELVENIRLTKRINSLNIIIDFKSLKFSYHIKTLNRLCNIYFVTINIGNWQKASSL